VWTILIYVIVGGFVWYATFRSGVHATIAGVVLGLMTPARPLLSRAEADDIADDISHDPTADEIRHQAFLVQESVSVAERLEDFLHPFTSYLIIPIFALANAGIQLSGDSISDAATSNVTLGVIVGLVVGKPIGVVLFTWIATRFGFVLPRGMSWGQFVGLGLAAGIGFTVSIFITGLAFTDPAVIDEAKIGILAASAIAAVLALVVLRASARDEDEEIDEHDEITSVFEDVVAKRRDSND
jgi:NhaA family Na+:H+ antiporter